MNEEGKNRIKIAMLKGEHDATISQLVETVETEIAKIEKEDLSPDDPEYIKVREFAEKATVLLNNESAIMAEVIAVSRGCTPEVAKEIAEQVRQGIGAKKALELIDRMKEKH